MLWMATGVRREVRKREKWAVQREKVGFYPSNNFAVGLPLLLGVKGD